MILSIIIPTYNRVNLIRYTLDSLGKSHHKGVLLDVIVVDDGSDDHTWEFISTNYATVRLLKNAGNGAAAARNTGLAASTGKYVVYLDSDDIAGENYFMEKIALLELNPSLDACYGDYEYFNSDAEFLETTISFKHKYPLLRGSDNAQKHLVNYLGGSYIPSLAIVWRKSFLLKYGGHDESLPINQDVEIFVRAIFNGLKIDSVFDGTKVYVRNHTVDTRVGDARNSSAKWAHILELRKRIFRELPKYNYDTVECRKRLSYYIFSRWKTLRHTDGAIAAEYLKFAKEIYWPIEIKGNLGLRLLARLMGPASVVKLKFFLFKKD